MPEIDTQQYDIFDLGFNKYLIRGSSALESTIEKIIDDLPLPSILGSGFYEIPPTQIGSGEIGGNLTMVAGLFQSANFVSGSAGWQIQYDGTVEFNSGTFRGSLVAASIHIPDQDTTANSFHTNTAGDSWWGCTETNFGSSNDNALAYILKTGVAKFQSLTILGGTVNYGKTSLADSTNAGYWISSDGFYFGSASDASYVKYTISGGAFTVYGATVDHPTITAIQSGTEIAIQGWQHDMAFSATDHDTVAWASGTITLLDGTTYSIDAGNTATMSAINYIYLDIGTSITVLQKTTTAATAVGTGKILIAVAQNVASGNKAVFQVFGGKALGGLGKLIVAADITADTITANELAANSVTATEINVTNLAAINADMGSITAGDIVVDSSGFIRGGQTAYDTGSGFWMGYNSTAYKFSFGDGTVANSIKWDGTDLIVKGTKLLFQDIFGNGADGDVTINSNTTLTRDMYYGDLTIDASYTLSPAGYRIFVEGTLTINGTISRVGNVGGNANGGAAGTGASAIGSGYLGGGGAGGRGGVGSGEFGQAGGSVTSALGGDAGDGGGTDLGAGTATAPPASSGSFKAYPAAVYLYDAIVGARIYGGGGASGGEGANNNGGGGGGSGAGVIVICAKVITIGAAGIITTTGGAGGNKDVTGNGGGGGGGADIILIYNSLTNSGSITAAGGAGGADNGAAGSAGDITYLEV